jgi:hypothetical protein
MNNKSIIFGAVLIAVVLFLAGIVYFNKGYSGVSSFDECVEAGHPVMESFPRKCAVPNGPTFTEDIGNVLDKTDLIRVSSPTPGSTVSRPLLVYGEARGYWFFEATAPVELLDSNGKVIGNSYITASGDWMTENFVPFTGEIPFMNPGTGSGTLIIHKSNASGLPEHDDSVSIPVKFGSDE